MAKHTQSVFLTPYGVESLAHLLGVYIRAGHILDCVYLNGTGHRFLEVKALLQRDPIIDPSETLAHLLIPYEAISLIALDDPSKKIGFAHE